MARFDYDVVIVGFGGSVAALRAVEKGYSVAVLEAGRRWSDADLPKTSWNVPKFAWQPELELFGIQRIRYLDDVIVLSGAGGGGGSLVYANTLYVPAKTFFDYPTWSHITDWGQELAPYYDQCNRMFGVQVSPYMETDSDRILREVAADMKRPYLRAPLGIYFGTPGVEAEDPYFGGAGPARAGCISCNDCMIGCPHGAKNKTTTNYLYLAEKGGAVVHDMHEVHTLRPLDGGGFEVIARHPGPLGFTRQHHRYKAAQVILSAHAFGTAQLLLSMKHDGILDKLSDEAGKRARTNSEALVSVQRSETDYRKDPDKVVITPGRRLGHRRVADRRRGDDRSGALRRRQQRHVAALHRPARRQRGPSLPKMAHAVARAPDRHDQRRLSQGMVAARFQPSVHARSRRLARPLVEARHAAQQAGVGHGAAGHRRGGGQCRSGRTRAMRIRARRWDRVTNSYGRSCHGTPWCRPARRANTGSATTFRSPTW